MCICVCVCLWVTPFSVCSYAFNLFGLRNTSLMVEKQQFGRCNTLENSIKIASTLYSHFIVKQNNFSWIVRIQFIREQMKIKNSVLDYIRYKQLNWYGHVQRMDQEKLPRRILQWYLRGRRRKGRPRNSWMQDVTTGMWERGIGNLEWVGIMWLALRSVKSNNVDFLNQIRYFSIK